MHRRAPVVAIVDDELPVRRALQRLLGTAGFETRLFSSGSEFMDALDGIDCLILDLHLPGMSGFDVQKALATKGSHIPVVVLTGNDTPANRTRSLAEGACAYLTKPVDGDQLLQTLNALPQPAPHP